MGVPRLRPSIETYEEIVPLAKLAEDHFNSEDTKEQPFRVAVDASDWIYHSVTQEKVDRARKFEPASNPVEKCIFWRICKLLTLNFRLVFVFDGPDAPPKPGRSAMRKIHGQKQDLLKQILFGLGVPYIEAPGEAEAECCRLNSLKLVDAVWSVDSDCLMFGCTLWIYDHRTPNAKGSRRKGNGDTARDNEHVRVLRCENFRAKSRLSREGCVLFAMMAGGDYGQGLRGCGASTALEAVRGSLGISLCRIRTQEECKRWRDHVLVPFFKRRFIELPVPEDFPNLKMLQWYNSPKTHSDEALRQFAAKSRNFDQPPREQSLLGVAVPRLNLFWDKYFQFIGPVLLTRSLANFPKSLPRQMVHGIALDGTTQKTVAGHNFPDLERKLEFTPFSVTSLTPMELGSWKAVKEKNQPPSFDPAHRVKCHIPTFLLRKVLPADKLDPPTPASKKSAKRKSAASITERVKTTPVSKKTRSLSDTPSKSTCAPQNSTQVTPGLASISLGSVQPCVTPSRPQKPHSPSANHLDPIIISDSDDDDNDDDELRLPPLRRPRLV